MISNSTLQQNRRHASCFFTALSGLFWKSNTRQITRANSRNSEDWLWGRLLQDYFHPPRLHLCCTAGRTLWGPWVAPWRLTSHRTAPAPAPPHRPAVTEGWAAQGKPCCPAAHGYFHRGPWQRLPLVVPPRTEQVFCKRSPEEVISCGRLCSYVERNALVFSEISGTSLHLAMFHMVRFHFVCFAFYFFLVSSYHFGVKYNVLPSSAMREKLHYNCKIP